MLEYVKGFKNHRTGKFIHISLAFANSATTPGTSVKFNLAKALPPGSFISFQTLSNEVYEIY